jgi:hypothetical protein
MADWLVSIQLEGGGFQGGVVNARPKVPVTFNTGQILLGLACAAKHWGKGYGDAMNRAAKWLVDTQDPDGCWRQYPTPFASPGDKSYETHVAWGLFEAARIEPSRQYEIAARRNIEWALGNQLANGWIDKCCLSDSERPLTHTLGYFLRGLVEAYRFDADQTILSAAESTARGIMSACTKDGFLAGCLDRHWQGQVPWVCLTGNVQVAHCLLMLYQITGDRDFRDVALSLNRFVRKTIDLRGSSGTRGGVKGSYPVDGGYGRFEYLNWAAKFFIDSNRLEAAACGA